MRFQCQDQLRHILLPDLFHPQNMLSGIEQAQAAAQIFKADARSAAIQFIFRETTVFDRANQRITSGQCELNVNEGGFRCTDTMFKGIFDQCDK